LIFNHNFAGVHAELLPLAISLLAWSSTSAMSVRCSSLLRLISDLSEEARDRIGANRHVNASEQLATEAVRCALLP
jgi:hypothetical protein